MADLLVHFASAFAAGRPLRDGRLRAILYVGVCLPDLLYKTLLYATGAPNWLCEPTHSPLALVAFCYAGALLFEEAWRKRAFAALLGGAYLHVLFDLGKNYLGTGVIPWAFPFSMQTVELGWYTNDDSIFFMLPALGAVALVEWSRRPGSRGIIGRRPASP
jgi:hypothetical protein